MLTLLIVGVLSFGVELAVAQSTEQTPAAAGAAQTLSTPTKSTDRLPTNFDGRWERTIEAAGFRTIGGTEGFQITAQDENGKIAGTFYSYAMGAGQCLTWKDAPFEGTYDGTTLKMKVTNPDPSCKPMNLTLTRSGDGKNYFSRQTKSGVNAFYNPR